MPSSWYSPGTSPPVLQAHADPFHQHKLPLNANHSFTRTQPWHNLFSESKPRLDTIVRGEEFLSVQWETKTSRCACNSHSLDPLLLLPLVNVPTTILNSYKDTHLNKHTPPKRMEYDIRWRHFSINHQFHITDPHIWSTINKLLVHSEIIDQSESILSYSEANDQSVSSGDS